MTPSDVHEDVVGDPQNVYGHGSARTERVYPDIFWFETESGGYNPIHFGAEDSYDVGGADEAEPEGGC